MTSAGCGGSYLSKAVTREVDRDRAVRLGELGHDVAPEVQRRGEAADEVDGALPSRKVVNAEVVGSDVAEG